MYMVAALTRASVINPDGLAIACGAERRCWNVEVARIAGQAAQLRAAGLQPGQSVVTLASNSTAYFESLMAIWWAGGIIVPLNTRLAWSEIRTIIEHSDATLFISDDNHAKIGKRALGEVPCIKTHLVLGGDWPAANANCEPFAARPDDVAAVFYTGGTTGLPKGVELTHANILYGSMTMHRELRHDAESVYLHVPPLYHLADFTTGLAVVLGGGAHSFLPQFSVDGFYERLRDDGVTHLQLVPTMLDMVLDAPLEQRQLLTQIRSIGYGAAPITEKLLNRIIEGFPNARIQQFYGMTESCGATVTLAPESHVLSGKRAGRLRSAGQAMPGSEIRIVDSEMNVCAPGATGEILMRGPGIMRGYARDPANTASTLVFGWLRSGDLGYLDDQGYLYVLDRLKDMIISGGENIYCGEVENALSSHPGVESCAVVGIPDARWGERVHAVVVVKPGLVVEEKALDDHCRSLIAGYKVPRSYEFRSDLPTSGVGKVQKHLLRQEWIARNDG